MIIYYLFWVASKGRAKAPGLGVLRPHSTRNKFLIISAAQKWIKLSCKVASYPSLTVLSGGWMATAQAWCARDSCTENLAQRTPGVHLIPRSSLLIFPGQVTLPAYYLLCFSLPCAELLPYSLRPGQGNRDKTTQKVKFVTWSSYDGSDVVG